MRIILIGMKSSGKSTIGKKLALKLKVRFIELDKEIEKKHNKLHGDNKSFQSIFKDLGEIYFRNLETETLRDLNLRLCNSDFVLSCGGGTPVQQENQAILKNMGLIIFLDIEPKILKKRIKNKIWQKSFDQLFMSRLSIYEKLADIKLNATDEKPEIIVSKIRKLI